MKHELKYNLGVFFAQFVYLTQNLIFPFLRRFLETVDIITQKGGVYPDKSRKFGHINFLMQKDEPLSYGRFRL